MSATANQASSKFIADMKASVVRMFADSAVTTTKEGRAMINRMHRAVFEECGEVYSQGRWIKAN